MEEWKKSKGEKTLRELGIKKGQKIVDFGCGEGVYTVIISRIIGETGKIFAIDKKKQRLEKVKTKLEAENIQNVELIKVSENDLIPIEKDSIDVFVLYDVYHLLDEKQRKNIIKEAAKVLKSGGFLSYHATHLDSYDINLENVKQLMKKDELVLDKKYKKPMFHWDWIEEGLILNFVKK